jgi:hypothetical protein
MTPIDSAVEPAKQAVATFSTFGAAVVALVIVVGLCRRRRIVWPVIVLVGGTATCLLEPLFDHLYGLWFPTQGQWHLFTTYGVYEPVWLPAAYLVVYGGLAIWVASALDRSPRMSTVWRLYCTLVVVAIVAEIGYIKGLGVYNYQGPQPFKLLGYPLFLGFVNSMSALISGLVLYRLAPRLAGRAQLALVMVPPLAFGVDAVGSGFLYLAVRHSEHPSNLLLDVTALTVAAGAALTVRLLALLLPEERPSEGILDANHVQELVLPAGNGDGGPGGDDSRLRVAAHDTAT